MKDCKHDYEHPVRYGRADWRCPKCKKNIMLELVFMREALDSLPAPKKFAVYKAGRKKPVVIPYSDTPKRK